MLINLLVAGTSAATACPSASSSKRCRLRFLVRPRSFRLLVRLGPSWIACASGRNRRATCCGYDPRHRRSQSRFRHRHGSSSIRRLIRIQSTSLRWVVVSLAAAAAFVVAATRGCGLFPSKAATTRYRSGLVTSSSPFFFVVQAVVVIYYIVSFLCSLISTINRVTSRGSFLPVCTVNLVLPETEIMKR